MIDTILEYFQTQFLDSLSRAIPALTALVFAFILGYIIYYVYTKSFRGVIYSHAFAISLAVMTILSTMVTVALSSNIALSLGLVGALSIVRYRTAVKDPMDLLFLFWAVASGITIGARLFYLALIGAGIVVLMLLAISKLTSKSKMYILVVHYTGEDIGDELRRILRGNRFEIKSRTVREDDVELALEIVVKDNNLAFMESIKKTPTVKDLTLIQYDGEYLG
jgi:hypothetical protein